MSSARPSTAVQTASATTGLAGKYMTFRLDREEYGLQILKVRELIGLMEITRVPGTAGYVRGVINLRGKVIPVVDLRQRFGLERLEATGQSVIIVVQVESRRGPLTMGLLVDEVLEVLALEQGQVEPPPELPDQTAAQFIVGVGKSEKRVIFLLDSDLLLSGDEQSALPQALPHS